MFLPLMLEAMGSTGVFCFYAGTNIIALIMIFLWVPETKQRTLEELDYVFAVPTRTHMHYQCFKALPWWWNTHIMRKKGLVLEPLYTFENSNSTDQSRINDLHAADRARAAKKTGSGSGSEEQIERAHSDDITLSEKH